MKSLLITMLALTPGLVSAASEGHEIKRVTEAGAVFSEIMSAPDKAIPQEILSKAQCIGIVPNLKRAGFVVGAKYGKGILTCRTGSGWSGPSIIRIEGGSVGLQIGAGETDLVFVVMNKSGEEKLMKDKFTFGGDAAAMAGPIGRSAGAQTDAMMRAEILSYSRARGVFAGLTLDGSTMRPDKDDNQALYGRAVTQKEILSGAVKAPADAKSLYTSFNQYAPSGNGSR